MPATKLSPSPKSSAPRRAAAPRRKAAAGKAKSARKSLQLKRIFSDAKVKPFDQIEWEKRTAEITDDSGKVIFKQENVEVPKSWSRARHQSRGFQIFLRRTEHAERETSVRQLDASRLPHDCRLGHEGRIFHQGRWRSLLRRTDLALREPIRRVQFAGLV